MALISVRPSTLKGSLRPASSLPLAQRMVWAACLGTGGVITHLPNHPSIRSILDLGEAFGAETSLEGTTADVLARGAPDPPSSLSCRRDPMLSRLLFSLSLFTGQPAALSEVRLPTGATRMLDGAAASLGVRILKTTDRFEVSDAPVNGALDLSDRAGAYWAPSMIMAAPLADLPIVFGLDEFVFLQPSVRMSLLAVEKMGITLLWEENEPTITFAPNQSYAELNAEVEADWRTGSYLAGALLLSGSGVLELPRTSVQPESGFLSPFEREGLAMWNSSGDALAIRSSDESAASRSPSSRSAASRSSPDRSGSLPIPSSWDLRAYPALYPLALVLATRAAQPVRIEPLYPLSPKARERLHSTAIQLTRIGADIRTSEGLIEVKPSQLEGGEVDCGGDARVAMALGLAGLISRQPISIPGAEAVSSVCPSFWSDLRTLGADVRIDYTASKPAPAAFSPVKKE